MNVDLVQGIDDKVVRLGSFMGLSNRTLEKGRADAHLVAQHHGELRTDEVWVSLAWKQRYPKRHVYGEAFNAALGTAAASWKVHNGLRAATQRIYEADFMPRPTVSKEGVFVFLQMTRNEEMCESIETTRALIGESESPATALDYLCFAATELDAFIRKLWVAVGDTVLLDEECYSPTLTFGDERLKVDSKHKKLRSNGVAFHHIVVKPLIV